MRTAKEMCYNRTNFFWRFARMQKIWGLIKAHWDVVVYLVFGVLTTVVNYLVYLPLYNWMGISAAVSNIAAWVVAVATMLYCSTLTAAYCFTIPESSFSTMI